MASSPYPQHESGRPPAKYPYQQDPAPYPNQHGPASSAEGALATNPLGLVAFIAGMLVVLWQLAGASIQAGVALSGDFTGLEVFGWINNGVSLVLGLVAVVAGVISLVVKGRSKVLGAIGLGIGILNLAGVLSYAVVYPLITSFA